MVRYIRILDNNTPGLRSILLIGFTAFCLAVLTAIVFTTEHFYSREGAKNSESTATYGATFDTDDGISEADAKRVNFLLIPTIIDVDPYRGMLKIMTDVYQEKPTTSNVTLYLGMLKGTPVSPTSLFTSQDAVLSMVGDINRYPYDKYNASGVFDATITNGTNITHLPIAMVAYGALQNWRFKMKLERNTRYGHVEWTINIHRSVTIRLFSIFVVVLMWLISLTATAIAIQVVVRDREVAPPLMGVMVSLLFALPALRNVQPMVPPIGTLAEVIGLFFNMALIALSAVTLMVKWIEQMPRPTK
jgi:hypothetical protein